MKLRVRLYIRQHVTEWYTVAALGQPAYAAHGPYPGALMEEVQAALEEDLAQGRLTPSDIEAQADMRSRRLDLVLRAVQHE